MHRILRRRTYDKQHLDGRRYSQFCKPHPCWCQDINAFCYGAATLART